jgi:hypothetical protein
MKTSLWSLRWSVAWGWAWVKEREVNLDTSCAWLELFREEEPCVTFEIATKRPKLPKGYEYRKRGRYT